MKPTETVVITIATPYTAWLRGPRIAWTLDHLELPKQWDNSSRCWMTSRQSVDVLAAYLQDKQRPVVVKESLS
jgi:hypothetical protein